MAAKNSSPELSFGDWEGEDVDELLKQVKLHLIAVVRFLGVAFVHSDQHARAKVFFLIICISMLYSKPTRRWFSYVL